MPAKPGDKVKIITEDDEFTGTLMPNEETDSVVLKLDNGYNIGIDKEIVKKITIITPYKETEEKKEPVKQNKKLPTISILHTGGTIASKVDYKTGGVVAQFSPEEIIQMFPELKAIANIRSKLISNMFSEDIRFIHYSQIAQAIEEEVKQGCKGIIVTHGTDTLTYTSAALSFMLENLTVPVILVGAQRSSDRGSSDAGMNLICAAEFIAKTDFCEVAICMHETAEDENCVILPGTKTKKLHSSRRDAFKSVNSSPFAKISYKTREIEFLRQDYMKENKGNLNVKDKIEEKVAILRVHTNMMPEQFEFYTKQGYKGLIIEGTGLGHAPVNVPNVECKIHNKNKEAIKQLVDSGCIVVMTLQTTFGRVHMHVYSSGIELKKIGVHSGKDMLTETAFIKLAWLLGNYKKEEAEDLIGKNLVGEITERSLYDKDIVDLKK